MLLRKTVLGRRNKNGGPEARKILTCSRIYQKAARVTVEGVRMEVPKKRLVPQVS